MQRHRRIYWIIIPLVMVISFVGGLTCVTHADNVEYIYDSQNRLIEVHYSDRTIKYTYDAAGNRTSTIVQIVAVLQINTLSRVAGRSSGGQQIVLTGSFANLSTVNFGGNGATWSYTNGAADITSITVTTPAHATGAVQIDLNPVTGNSYSKPNAFAYLPTVFTDDSIVVGQTTAKAQHITELREAVDALRAVAGLGGAPWNDPSLASGDPIRAVHILDLRTYLDDAATRLGYSTLPYTDAGLSSGFVIKRIHIEELRQRIRDIAS